MKRILGILLLLCLCQLQTFAQSNTFSKFFWQQDGRVAGSQIKQFNNGYIMAQGKKMPGKNLVNICISRLTSKADTLWNRVIEDTVNNYYVKRICLTSDHHILITGMVDDTVVIGKERAFVLKTDTLGNKIWMIEFGLFASWAYTEGNDIIELPGNAYLMVGYRNNGNASDLGGLFLYKIDTAGNEIWTSYYWGSGDHANSVLYNPVDSGFYVTGINYDYNADERDRAGLFRFDKNGTMLWRKHYASEKGKKIVYDASGIIMLTNRKLIKTNLNGDSIWALDFNFQLAKLIYYPSSSLEDMTRTTDGGYVIGGYLLEGFKDWQFPGESTNYRIIKIDSNGTERWNKSYSIGVRNEYPTSIIETKDTGLMICGTSAAKYSGESDTWLVKTDSLGKQYGCLQLLEKNTTTSTQCAPEASAFDYHFSVPHDSSKTYSFTWSLNGVMLPGETKQFIELIKPGTYKAYVIDSVTGCEDSSGMMIIAFNPPPAGFSAGNDIVRCLTGGAPTINLSSQGKPTGQGSWSGPDLTSVGDNSVNPNNLGYGSFPYVFSVMQNNSSCIFKDTMFIVLDTVKPVKPVITSNKTQPMCKGDTVTLSIPVGYTNAVWSTRNVHDKKDSLVAKYKDSMNVYLFATTPGLVCRDSASYKISFKPVEPAPIIVIKGAEEFCEGDSTLISTVIPYDYYLWESGDTTREVYAKKTNLHLLKVKNNNTCLSNWSNMVIVYSQPRPDIPSIIQNSATTLLCILPADSFTWYVNDSLLPLYTQQITAPIPGTYKVIIHMHDNFCESYPSEEYILQPNTGLKESNAPAFSIYPNPAGNFISIEHFNPTHSMVTLKVFSMIGEHMQEQVFTARQKPELDLSALTSGSYILVIEDGDTVYRKIFVKD